MKEAKKRGSAGFGRFEGQVFCLVTDSFFQSFLTGESD